MTLNQYTQSLQEWVNTFGPVELDQDLGQFIDDEIASNTDLTEVLKWQRQLIELIQHLLYYNFPLEKLIKDDFQETIRQTRNAGEALFVMHCATAQITKQVLALEYPTQTTFGQIILNIRGQRFFTHNNLILSHLGYLSLQGIELLICDLIFANLSCANLSHTNLSGANLYQANLSDAILSDVNLSEVYLIGANLSGANLQNAKFNYARIRKGDLIKWERKETDFPEAYFID